MAEKTIWHSIIISLKNDSKGLELTLQSFFIQNKDILGKIEIIVVDSNSIDQPYKIVSKFKNKLNIIFKSSYDASIYEAWNKAILMSSGLYISFLGAGDTLTPQSLDYLYSNSFEFNPETIYTSQTIMLCKDGSEFLSGKSFDYFEFRKKFTTNHSLLMYSNDIFYKYGDFSLDFGVAADYEFLLRIGRFIKPKHINYPTCSYPIGGLSSRSIKTLLSVYKIRRSLKVNSLIVDIYLLLKSIMIFYIRQIIGHSCGRKISNNKVL